MFIGCMMARKQIPDEQILELLDVQTDLEDETDIEDEDDDPTGDIILVHRLDCQDDSRTITIDINNYPDESNDQENIDVAGGSNNSTQTQPNNSNRKWRKKDEKLHDTTFTPHLQKVHFFRRASESFDLFFDEDILELIHYQTNLKSVQKGKPAHITHEEIRVFIGINLVMGYNKYNCMSFYWKSGEDIGTEMIKKSMSRNRFFEILSCLHLNDNAYLLQNKHDKLYKLRPFIERLNKNFTENKVCEEYLSIDEATIKFKGRSSLKQYNPMKPVKRGYKLWCLADDKGYIYKFEIYCGKASDSQSTTRKQYGLGGDVVLSLTSDIAGINHKLTFDNFFSSIPLLEILRERKLLACGTIRQSRKDFPALEVEKLKRGDYDYRATPNGITVFKWQDTKTVHFISNYHGVDTTTVQRRQKDGRKIVVKCPTVARDYNQHMGGVDKHDMYKQLYGIDRKSVKWWHRLFFGLLDMSLVNSFLLFKQHTESPISLLEYRREIATSLITHHRQTLHPAPKRRKSTYSIPDSTRLGNVGSHFPVFNNPKGRCEVCSRKSIESRPTSKCSFCGINLCCNSSKNCFMEFHHE